MVGWLHLNCIHIVLCSFGLKYFEFIIESFLVAFEFRSFLFVVFWWSVSQTRFKIMVDEGSAINVWLWCCLCRCFRMIVNEVSLWGKKVKNKKKSEPRRRREAFEIFSQIFLANCTAIHWSHPKGISNRPRWLGWVKKMKINFFSSLQLIWIFDLNLFMIFENSSLVLKWNYQKEKKLKRVTKKFCWCFGFSSHQTNQGCFVNILFFFVYFVLFYFWQYLPISFSDFMFKIPFLAFT